MRRNSNYISGLVLITTIWLFSLQSAAAQNPAASTQSLEKYVGQYQMPGNYIVIIRLEGGRLVGQWSHVATKSEFVAESEDLFSVRGESERVTFIKDAQGQITGLIWYGSGNEYRGEKISSQTETPAKPIDKSPHKSGFVTANGIKMHYLDWGGSGDVLLLLAGLGSNAHIFDDFAPKFTDRFRVIALTRRGFGESDKPQTGYDAATRVEDIRQFLDAMNIKQASLIGHSMAGDEMTLFASLHPKRVKRLVYLDAAYNRSNLAEVVLSDPSTPPFWKRLMLDAIGSRDAAEVVVKDMPPPEEYKIYVALEKAIIVFRPDYAKVKAPALAFFAVSEEPPAATSLVDEGTRKKIDAWWKEKALPYQRRSIEQFRKGMWHGRVVEMKDAGHFLFLGKTQDEVVRRTREFLLE